MKGREPSVTPRDELSEAGLCPIHFFNQLGLLIVCPFIFYETTSGLNELLDTADLFSLNGAKGELGKSNGWKGGHQDLCTAAIILPSPIDP